jgi:hypothetical protein
MKRPVAAALVLAVAFVPAAAQQSVLDRTIEPASDGGPFVVASPPTSYTGSVVLGIGRMTRTPVGFEAAPDDDGRPAREEIESMKDRERISLAGKTVHEALDAIVAADPRYWWVDVHGVPVVRPVGAWVDPDNPLNRTVRDVVWEKVSMFDVLTLTQNLIEKGPKHAPVYAEPTLSIRVQSGAVLDVLNEIVLAHGEMGWRVSYRCRTSDPRFRDGLYLELVTFSRSRPGWGSCRPARSAGRMF